MSLSQGYSVGKVLFLPVLNDSGSDCTIVTFRRRDCEGRREYAGS
jgi:hypothetical protein